MDIANNSSAQYVSRLIQMPDCRHDKIALIDQSNY